MKHTSRSGRLYKRCERVEAYTLDQVEKSSPRASMTERKYVWHASGMSHAEEHRNRAECIKQEFRL